MTEPVKADGKGERKDEGKPRVDLIPPDALLELGAVYAYGSKKYFERNWERGMPWSKMVGPLFRHLLRFMAGEERDAESGYLHIAHVAWNALGLLAYTLRGIGEDDRQKLMASGGVMDLPAPINEDGCALVIPAPTMSDPNMKVTCVLPRESKSSGKVWP